jgi:hypothetical protein
MQLHLARAGRRLRHHGNGHSLGAIDFEANSCLPDAFGRQFSIGFGGDLNRGKVPRKFSGVKRKLPLN